MMEHFVMERFKIAVYSWAFLLWNFIDSWFASIPWRGLILGMPFVVTLVFLISSYLVAGTLNPRFRHRLVQSQTERSLESGDWKTAKLLLFRQSQADPQNLDYQFGLAQVYAADGEPEAAVRIVRGLVFTGFSKPLSDTANESDLLASEIDSTTFAKRTRFRNVDKRFLMWMVENVYAKTQWQELNARDQDDYLEILAALHIDNRRDVAVAQMYVDRLLQSKRYQDALPVLVTLIPSAPGIGLRAAIIAKSLGYHENADRYATTSLESFQQLLHQDPGSAELAVAFARCQVFLSKHAEAIETIDRAIGSATDNKVIETLLGIRVEAIVAWAEFIDAKKNVAIEDRMRLLQLLQVSLKHSPNNPQLLRMVTSHVLAVTDGDGVDFAVLRDALVSGVSPAISHFIHGTAAVVDGNLDEARVHLEIASRAFPDSDVILNNLAYVLAEADGGNLDDALRVSQASIDRAQSPTPFHYETRGQILFKLGRWLDAAHDLELALAEPRLAERVHRSLSVCYSELGLTELSENHAKVAAHLASTNEGSQ